MNGISSKAWRKRVLATIVSATLAVGIVGADVSAAIAQVPEPSPNPQTAVVDEGPNAAENGEGAKDEAPATEGGNAGEASKSGEPGGDTALAKETTPEGAEAAVENDDAAAEDQATADDPDLLTLEPYTPDELKTDPSKPSVVNRATGTCPVVTQEFGFGKGSSYSTSDRPEGTVLGYNGVPTDLGTANQHFVYYPLPDTSTEVEYPTGFQETVSLSKYTNGDAGDFGLAIDANGAVWAWGGNRYGQLGNGTSGNTNSYSASPARVSTLPAGVQFVQVSAGSGHALALTKDGDIYAWGSINNYGQLGQGNTTTISGGQSRALKINVPGVKFKQISGGWDYSLAVDTLGNAWAWGKNNNGATAGVGTGALRPRFRV
ncbi:hypothetical protein G7068_09730 [Leucobacter viscericola]|uniref:Regulator of chromosome condensation (RCC1) repeat-containing protein n=1 Tax=Leucobacter viscericola TaxID=2714935 RepID=A0A6G7XGE6_9MICO|nr:hypothetical protein [Leucobacter viscericola]QIK63448.1 hypothetical protein G7068_09730 [Leucobacter viscericola]